MEFIRVRLTFADVLIVVILNGQRDIIPVLG